MVNFDTILSSDTIKTLTDKVNGNFLKVDQIYAVSGNDTTLKLSFTNSLVCTINHNQNTYKVQATSYNSQNKEVIPNEKVLVDANTLELRFVVPFTGYIIVSF